MLPEFFEFYNPTKVVFGVGLAQDFQTELEAIGVKRLFVVSDRVVKSLGLVDKVTEGLKSGSIEVAGEYSDVPPDAELDAVIACSEQAQASDPDGLLAIGGGSVIDAAKAANILVCEGGNLLEDYLGIHTLTRPLKPLIVIPTTAGTGSEVTMVSVVYDRENEIKIPFTDKYLLPNLAVLDPEMTTSMPPKLTAATAMDALTHAVEAFVGLQAAPIPDALAMGAVELILGNLERACKNGLDLDARSALSIASNMAGIAFSHSMVGCVHAMAHTVGGLYHVPHGVANGILLPHGMEYNFEEVKEKLAKLGPVMGHSITGITTDVAAKKVIEAVKTLQHKLNRMDALPLTLREVGVPKEGLPAVAEGSVMDGAGFYNSREMNAEDILVHLKNAY